MATIGEEGRRSPDVLQFVIWIDKLEADLRRKNLPLKLTLLG